MQSIGSRLPRTRPTDHKANTRAETPSFRGDIQGIRGIAVLLVVAFHANVLFGGGFVGVDVFFVVSGFVITRLLTKELRTEGRLSFRRFYLRRIRRLLPALGLLLAMTMLLSIVLLPIGAQQITARTGAAAVLFNANTYLTRYGGDGGYFGLGAESNALLHTWSLSVEEQFYLVMPALVAASWVVAVRRRVNPRRVVGVVLGTIFAVSFALSWLLTSGRLDPSGFGAQIAFYSAPTRAWEFAAGGILAIAGGRAALVGTRRAGTVALAGMVLIAFAALRFDAQTPFPGTAALLPVLGTAFLLLAGGACRPNVITRALAWRPLQFVGDLSYSWYLWHWPIIVFAGAIWPTSPIAKVAAAAFSLLPAWLSYRLVESRFRSQATPRARRTLALGAVCVLVPLIAAVGLEVGHRQLTATGTWKQFSNHADLTRGCDNSVGLGQRDISNCLWLAPASTGRAVLIGDSNAGHFTEGFVAAANAVGLDALVATKAACPFVDIRLWNQGGEKVACAEFVAQSVADLVQHPPRLVVIASASDTYIESNLVEVRSPNGGAVARTPAEKADAWAGGLGRIIQRLRGAGIEVIIVHPAPRLPPDWSPLRLAPVRLFGPPSWYNASVSRADAMQYRSLALAAENQAAGDQARTIDVFDELCAGGRCAAYDGTHWLYLDSLHITVASSRMLTEVFRSAFAAAVHRP